MIPKKSPVYSYEHIMRSRYSETDRMGYVYYGRYLEYFEVARTEMIRAAGISYRELEEQGVMLPVVESHVKYKAPLLYDDQVVIKVHLYEMPTVKLKTFYEMFTRRSQQLHAEGKVILCFMKEDTRKPCRTPQAFIDELSKAIKG